MPAVDSFSDYACSDNAGLTWLRQCHLGGAGWGAMCLRLPELFRSRP